MEALNTGSANMALVYIVPIIICGKKLDNLLDSFYQVEYSYASSLSILRDHDMGFTTLGYKDLLILQSH